jgi:hypothetical protein
LVHQNSKLALNAISIGQPLVSPADFASKPSTADLVLDQPFTANLGTTDIFDRLLYSIFIQLDLNVAPRRTGLWELSKKRAFDMIAGIPRLFHISEANLLV